MYISEILHTAPEETRGDLENKTYEALEKYQIVYDRVDNDSVETMEECLEISEKLDAEIRKTIVVCDRKKTQYYLVVLPADKRFDGKKFSAMMQSTRVSFAKAEDMEEILGVVPGSATVMSILNDTEGKVKVVIDQEVADAEYFACNTGANTTHIKMKTNSLIKNFLPGENHKPDVIAV